MYTKIKSQFLDTLPYIKKNESDIEVNAYMEDFLNSLKAVSNLLDESVYVVDFHKRCFRYVSDKGIFLCGRSPQEVMQSGYNFYHEVVHPDDYSMLVKIHQAVIRYIYHPNTPIHDLAYIVFNYRLHGNRGMLMVRHRVTPLIVNDQALMAVCSVSYSTNKTPGNLFAYYNGQDVCYQYSLSSERWKKVPMIQLSPREKNILELYRAGIARNDVADILFISPHTLRNHEASIYDKLNVHSMMQAINYAVNHRLIFVPDHFAKRKKTEEQPNDLPLGGRWLRTSISTG